MVKAWIEAMRLRTLPVSIAGVITAVGFCEADGHFLVIPSAICLLFAVLAQIASNFANEYYDFKKGFDKPGREGPRRGVTEGDISPTAMKSAVFIALALSCAVGLSLIPWGGWWLIAAGALIAVGVLAYSAGPYPLSHHALGEVAVIFFFGIIPVNFTYFIEAGSFGLNAALGSLSIGLMGANVLLVNNYRDSDDDAAVGKTTIAVKFGPRVALELYRLNGIVAVALMGRVWGQYPAAWLAIPAVYLIAHLLLTRRISRIHGRALNPMLGLTALLMLFYALGFAITTFCN